MSLQKFANNFFFSPINKAFIKLLILLRLREENDVEIIISPFLKLKKDIINRLKINRPVSIEYIKDVERFFFKRLLSLQRKNSKEPKKRRSNKEKANQKQKSFFVLRNFCSNISDANIVYECFNMLKEQYAVKSPVDALRMIRCANIFKNSHNEIKLGLQEAARNNICSGFWLGEAAIDLTHNGGNKPSLSILENSAKKGNELSQLILECYNLYGGERGTTEIS